MLLFLFILVSAKSFIRKTDLVARFVIMLALSFSLHAMLELPSFFPL